MPSDSVEEAGGEPMESGPNPVSFTTSFLPQHSTRDPSVVGLLLGELSSTDVVDGLNATELGERDLDQAGFLRVHGDSIQGRFVGVEREESGGIVRFWRRSLEEQNGSVGRNLELLDSSSFCAESVPVEPGKREEEGAPLAVSERETDFAGFRVEVKGLGVRSEEESADVGNSRMQPLTNPSSVSLGERKGDVGGDDGVLAGELVDERPISGEPGDGAAGGLS